jgi:hypothetical protein
MGLDIPMSDQGLQVQHRKAFWLSQENADPNRLIRCRGTLKGLRFSEFRAFCPG